MKTSHVFWGTLFISFGLLVLINNFSSILMDWGLIWKLWPVVTLFLAVMGGIYAGLFTPTEGAAIGAFVAAVLGFLLVAVIFAPYG